MINNLSNKPESLVCISFCILVPRDPRFFFFFNLSRVALVTEKNLNFWIGRLKMNAQQGATFYPSTHNVFLPVEFQMLARVYQPVEI